MKPEPVCLVLGGSGMIGTACQSVFASRFNILAPTSAELNIFSNTALEQIKAINPDILIYAVSNELLDDRDDNAICRAWHVNVRFPRLLLDCLRQSAKLVTFSTDMVFPERDAPYIESDAPIVTSPYSMLKIGADSLLGLDRRNIIVRLSRIFGPSNTKKIHPVEKVLLKLGTPAKVELIDDVYKSFTYSFDVARKLLSLVQSKYASGLYHIANAGRASMLDFFNFLGAHIAFRANIVPVRRRELSLAKLPQTTILASRRIEPMRNWQEAASDFVENYINYINSLLSGGAESSLTG